MNLAAAFAGGLLTAASPSTQIRPQDVAVSVPASAGDLAVNRLAAQTDVSVVIEVDLWGRRTSGLHGRYGIEEAFERLLTPLGARAVRISPDLYRIEPLPRPAAPVPHPRPSAPPPVEPTVLDEVVVTAVRRGGLDEVSGRSLISKDGLTRTADQNSSGAVAGLSASVESTRQGMGRNKLFVRGVADSALSGPLQATVGQYFGEFRLGFGVPDPDLVLADIQGVEVFEGPQGSRFGAGSIGGVVRISPEAPDLTAGYGLAAGGVSGTLDGAPGADGRLVFNRPVGGDSAVRLVAYGRREGGFIDAPDRGHQNLGAVDVFGGRLAYRRTNEDWTLDLLALAQGVTADNAPMVQDTGSFQAAEALAQPYAAHHALLGVSLSRRLSRGRVTTAVSVSRQGLDETFDASIPETGLKAQTRREQTTDFASFETRLETALSPIWTLNAGLSLAQAGTTNTRILSPPISGVRPEGRVDLDRTAHEAALFGDLVAHPSQALAFSIGGRLSRAKVSTRIWRSDDTSADPSFGQADVTFTPALGLRWDQPNGVIVFSRYEKGVRPGDVSEVQGFGRPYRADRVTLAEIGAASAPDRPWRLEAAVGRIDWADMQSDSITLGGDLVTANIGDGRIAFARLSASWIVSDRLQVSGVAFFNQSRLILDGPSVIGVPEGDLPNVAPASGQASIAFGAIRLGGYQMHLALDGRYVGRSRPGFGPGLNRSQGGYLDADLSARLEGDTHALVFSVANPLDVSATRFAIGSPYRLYDGGVAPVRPLTIRLGFEARF